MPTKSYGKGMGSGGQSWDAASSKSKGKARTPKSPWPSQQSWPDKTMTNSSGSTTESMASEGKPVTVKGDSIKRHVKGGYKE